MKIKNKKILFFHGLESSLPSSKAKWIQEMGYNVHSHPMMYKSPDAFKHALSCAKSFNPDYIVGSSMGGYFALIVGTHIPTSLILLNPALNSRSLEFNITKGTKRPKKIFALLGNNDKVINPIDSEKELLKMNAQVNFGNHAHRTPINIFSDYFSSLTL